MGVQKAPVINNTVLQKKIFLELRFFGEVFTSFNLFQTVFCRQFFNNSNIRIPRGQISLRIWVGRKEISQRTYLFVDSNTLCFMTAPIYSESKNKFDINADVSLGYGRSHVDDVHTKTILHYHLLYHVFKSDSHVKVTLYPILISYAPQ